MDENFRQPDRTRTRLPGSVAASNPSRAGSPRESGLRRVRRMSNWTLAALLVGVGATTAGLARTIPTTTSSTVAASASGSATSAVGGQSSPRVTNPVATTSASGVVAPSTGPSTTSTRVAGSIPVASGDS